MRLMPDTLIGRTALVLVAALAVVLVAALALFAGQRSEALANLGGRNTAERVAALALLVEETPPAQRRQTLRSQDNPGFRAFWSAGANTDDSDETGLAASVAEHLRQRLDGREVRVSTRIPAFGPGSGHGMGPGMHGPGGPPPALRIAVRLNDEGWLNVVAPLDDPGSLFRPRFLAPLLLALLVVTAAALWAVGRAA
ncbi:MAG: two-component sensor histidine kinase, partial [Magnetospirillum sp.]|nr:two-component sensor histidine kinase [Magnetospirillum sp.]